MLPPLMLGINSISRRCPPSQGFSIEWLAKTHNKFEKDKGGKVFVVFSIKKEGKKLIYNPEVIDEMKKEVERLRKE